MKKVTILCVGKIKEKYLLDGIAEYAKRLSRFCAFEIVEIPDEKGGGEVKKESELVSMFKGSILGCDIGINSKGFSYIAILAVLLAIGTLLIMYASFRV